MTKNQQEKDLRILDIITREVGKMELEDPKPSPDDKRWAESVVADMHARIAEYRKSRLPKTVPPIKKREPISKALLALPRAALETLFVALCQESPDVQLAFRNLDELSDNDLRRTIQAMQKAGRKGPRG
ncbi:MAG TPA: hypothetical protein VMJ10_06205 [Kofleriaceae bacterium]|nr:hypothetical protein [Kofleriaceae bacterium]